jgi:hypothetical protein
MNYTTLQSKTLRSSVSKSYQCSGQGVLKIILDDEVGIDRLEELLSFVFDPRILIIVFVQPVIQILPEVKYILP